MSIKEWAFVTPFDLDRFSRHLSSPPHYFGLALKFSHLFCADVHLFSHAIDLSLESVDFPSYPIEFDHELEQRRSVWFHFEFVVSDSGK